MILDELHIRHKNEAMIQTRLSLLRNKFFLFLGLIVLLSLSLLVINSIQSNESLLQEKIEKLELQNDAYGKQIEAEKNEQHQRLSAERDLYERTKKELNQKLRDLKEIHDKENQEASLRFNSLQQQYKILKTQHDDLTQHCEQVKKDLATDNDGLKSRLDKMQAQLSKTHSTNENEMTMWKAKYESLLSEKEKLENLLDTKQTSEDHAQLLQMKYKMYQIEQENKDLRQKLHIDEPEHQSARDSPKSVDKNFQEQLRMEDQNVLQQPMPGNGKSSTTTTTTPTSVVKKENLMSPVKASSTIKTSARVKPLPKGILPIPEFKNDIEPKSRQNEEVKAVLDETLGKPQNLDVDEKENGANEEHDNDFKIEEKNLHNNIDDGFDQENVNQVNNNAAEEFDAHKPADKARNDEMDLEIINRPAKDKLNDEIAGDHGKEPDGYPEMEDLHMIEGQQEENDDLGDVGEYDDPKAIKQGGVAERN